MSMGFLDSKYPVKILLLILVLFIIYKASRNVYYLSDNAITVAKVYDEYIANTASYAKYRYKVGDVWYDKRAATEDKGTSNIFYYVKYSKKKPEISQILLDEPVKDTVDIKEAGFKLNE